MALLRFLLIFFIIIFIFRVIAKFVFRSFVRNVQKNYEGRQPQDDKRKEGDVTINVKPQKGKVIDKNDGDYVDYEEVK